MVCDVSSARADNATRCREGLALRSASLLLPIVGLRATATAAAAARGAVGAGFEVDGAVVACKRGSGDGRAAAVAVAADGGLYDGSSVLVVTLDCYAKGGRIKVRAATRGKHRSASSGDDGGGEQRPRPAMTVEQGGRRRAGSDSAAARWTECCIGGGVSMFVSADPECKRRGESVSEDLACGRRKRRARRPQAASNHRLSDNTIALHTVS
jgi:hypothetical protein